MTSAELTDRIIALIDVLIPHSTTEDVTAAVSILMATASAARGNQLLLLAREAWRSLDQLRSIDAIVPVQTVQEKPPADEPPSVAVESLERLHHAWSRALARDSHMDRKFTDLMFRLMLIKEENRQLMERANDIAARARRLRTATG
jgi:hypothetical protein